MKHIKASNWVAEVATATPTGFQLRGTSKGYASFKSAFSSSQDVFYSAHDEDGNREAGYANFNGSSLVGRHATATLVSGVYNGLTPSLVNFNGDVTLACTFNASAFNLFFESLQALDPNGDGNINIPPELIDGLNDSLGSKADKVDLDKEIQDRKDGDKALQDQIDNIEVDAGNDYDDTQIKADLSTETQARIDGDTALDLRIDAVEDSISGGGGFIDAPDDGKLYGRQSEDWAEVPAGGVSDWADIENKPTEFPPSAHTHEITEVNGLQDALDNAGGDSPDYSLPVTLRSGAAQLPLTLNGAKLAVMTRGGELELPLAA